MRHVENLADRHMEKSHVLLFLAQKDPAQIIGHDIMAPKKCENEASWSRFCVKIWEICYF